MRKFLSLVRLLTACDNAFQRRLQSNGGPTLTHELLMGSPALNAGDPSFSPPPDFDQRGSGFPRVFNTRIDIGAFEVPAARS